MCKDVSIIIPYFNQSEITDRCVSTIISFVYKNDIELILVDDGSQEFLVGYDATFVIRNEKNLGYLRSCNIAAERATGDYLLFLNNDTLPQSGWLDIMVDTIKNTPNCGAVGCKLIWPNGLMQEAGSIVWQNGSTQGYGRGKHPDLPEFNYLREVDYCSAACLLTPRKLFLELGKFDELYIPAYYEDVDYCFKLKNNGYKVFYQPLASVIHHEMKSMPPHEAVELMLSNRKVFYDKWEIELDGKYQYDEFAVLKARDLTKHSKNILFLDDAIPNPDEGQGFNRAFNIVQSMHNLGNFVTVFPTKRPQLWYGGKHTRILQQQGIEVFYTTDEDIILNFKKLAETRKGFYDIVFISRPYNMNMYWNRVKNLFPGTEIIYDAEALYCMRDFLKAEIKGFPVPEPEKETILHREIALCKHATKVTCVSSKEKQILKSNGVKRPQVLNYRIDPRQPQTTSRNGLLFVGGNITVDSPNEDAVLYLQEYILPELPYTLTVVGKSDTVNSLGNIENLNDIYDKHKVFVAPHRFASGIPCKVYDAMANGIPCVISSLLADQIGAKNCYLIAETKEEFVDKIKTLYEDECLWAEIQKNAFEFIINNCNQNVFEKALEDILKNKSVLML